MRFKSFKSLLENLKSEFIYFIKIALNCFRDIDNNLDDEYNSVFSEDNSLVVFIRKNVPFNTEGKNKFLNHLKELGFNDEQVTYANELLVFISQNGQFSRQDLLRDELNFGGIFNSIQIQKLLKEIESRL